MVASTAEETAYAVYALAACHQHGLPVSDSCLSRGLDYLSRHGSPENDENEAPLWIAKVLYRPKQAVLAAVLAAQVLATQALRLEDDSSAPTQRTA